METLVQEGLLTKALGDADRRTIRIALSPAGQTRSQQLNETLDAHLSDFFLAFRDDVLIGSAGLERYGDTALLRSVAVAVPERGHSLGQALVQQVLAYAASLGVCQVVLLTTTAADFFLRLGFQPISRAEVPLAAQASVEFQEACPASAIVMSLVLEVERG